MENLTVEAARHLLMEDDIPALSAADENPDAQLEAERPAPGEVSDDNAVLYDENSVGLGVDIVEIDRMKRLLVRTPSFAAKEAVVKALGTGFSEGIGVRDIEVERAKNGRPFAKLSGRALEIAESQGVRELSISLSYTHTDAVACAMAVTDAAVRASEKRKDPMEELARQFKDVRGMLDEL